MLLGKNLRFRRISSEAARKALDRTDRLTAWLRWTTTSGKSSVNSVGVDDAAAHPRAPEAGRPDIPMRTQTFGAGGSGMATHLIVECRRLVEIIQVAWYG
ncbi:hypothetical protein N5079_30190 [Planotetraspora sp. A-T 1434]|uniref:hypothetical protein n=1 Tax=Planotetraspora sp. A-T 1434 TaxID=2979219 RepID=UPI0021BEFE99|nr:hypothetical protein [Planotetraspora sp. A-T 1434]MCT9934484.1 hypothetical protein [Planotetraspora sp. A-T 1434]